MHGLHGELYLNPSPRGADYLALGRRFFLSPEDADDPLVPCIVTRVGGTDERPLLRLDLSQTREQAVTLQGRELLATGGLLDELPHFSFDELIGARLETADGRHVGTISDVIEAPAHELLEITRPAGGTLLLPLVDELITVDAEAGVVRVVAGLLDDELEG